MNHKLSVLIFFVSSLFSVQAQELEIHEIKLKDTILKSTISDYIKETKTFDSEFNHIGYIIVVIKGLNNYNKEKDIFRIYNIYDSSYPLEKNDQDIMYPNYYTYVDDKLVLIYNDLNKEVFDYTFSCKSKKKMRTLMEPFLSPKIKSKDLPKNKLERDFIKDFREQYVRFRHTELIIIKDKEPIVIKNVH
ncbi:hypothetical protein [Xanthomarina spongicola]|uniref:Uncharacterized protein n=1 Tax=Xanthomarina spongicola TaxID=570520 RepID=A0A316DU47_9FLAO|nr:hypothetical protein [Xanthomarina spongicola]PWK20942.1 hypothetical protein LX78_00649 [Xanthomarina spongicola]